jgi:hypothetical protein
MLLHALGERSSWLVGRAQQEASSGLSQTVGRLCCLVAWRRLGLRGHRQRATRATACHRSAPILSISVAKAPAQELSCSSSPAQLLVPSLCLASARRRSVCRRAVIVVSVDRLRAAAPHAGARAASRQAATRSHGRTASSFPHCFDHQHRPQYPRQSTHDLSRVQLLYRCASASRRGLVLARPSVLPRSRARGG